MLQLRSSTIMQLHGQPYYVSNLNSYHFRLAGTESKKLQRWKQQEMRPQGCLLPTWGTQEPCSPASSHPLSPSHSPKCSLADLCKLLIFDRVVAKGKLEVVMVRHLTHGPAASLPPPRGEQLATPRPFPRPPRRPSSARSASYTRPAPYTKDKKGRKKRLK